MEFCILSNCIFKEVSCEIPLLAHLNKTTQLSVSQKGSLIIKGFTVLPRVGVSGPPKKSLGNVQRKTVSKALLNNEMASALKIFAFKTHFLHVAKYPCLWVRSKGTSTWHISAVCKNEKRQLWVTVEYADGDAWVTSPPHFTKLNVYSLGLVSFVMNMYMVKKKKVFICCAAVTWV